MFRTYKFDAETQRRGDFFSPPLFAESADWIWSARYVITEDAQRRMNLRGKTESYRLKELFPKPFDVSYL